MGELSAVGRKVHELCGALVIQSLVNFVFLAERGIYAA
jgi:hypothetical protein